jgi:hypothetical protein
MPNFTNTSCSITLLGLHVHCTWMDPAQRSVVLRHLGWWGVHTSQMKFTRLVVSSCVSCLGSSITQFGMISSAAVLPLDHLRHFRTTIVSFILRYWCAISVGFCGSFMLFSTFLFSTLFDDSRVMIIGFSYWMEIIQLRAFFRSKCSDSRRCPASLRDGSAQLHDRPSLKLCPLSTYSMSGYFQALVVHFIDLDQGKLT